MKKRGANLALEIIVIAVILLVVLVVMIYMFGSKANLFAKATGQSCQERNGECLGNTEKSCDEWTNNAKPVKIYSKGCVPTGNPPAGYKSDSGSSEVGACCVELGK
jgi:flagellar basal body-associated protein FliL